MTDDHSEPLTTKPPNLNPTEISEILSKTLIAKLATVDHTGSIHLVLMWFIHENEYIFIPPLQKTQISKSANQTLCVCNDRYIFGRA